MFHHSINKGLAIACLLSIFSLTFIASAHRQDFRVTEASLTADDARMSGPCPIKVVFNGYITTDGPGTVKYTFTRSDGATAPVLTMDFKEAGRQPVSTDWTLGDAIVLPHFGGWQAIRILSPNSYESNKATFVIDCQAGKEKQPDAQPAGGRQEKGAEASQKALPNLAAAVGEPSQTSKGSFIACPVKETRTEVTTPLPKPWWNTPQIGKLERVSVQTIAGNQTLVCEYWAYGRSVSIMRAFPEGATDCAAEGNGFRCR